MTDVETDEVLEALREQLVETSTPVASAPAIAERLPVGRRAVLDHLRILEARDDVASVQVGPGVGWYIPEIVTVEAPPAVPPAEPAAEPSGESVPSTAPPAEPAAEPPSETESAHAHQDGVRATPNRDQAIDDLQLPGNHDRVVSKRREAVRAVLEYLDGQDGPTPASELRELYDEYPAGYQHATSWWSNFMQPALKDLREQGVVRLENPSRGRWETA